VTLELKAAVRREGFDAVGVARAERLDRDGEALSAWLRRDYQAAMSWMKREPDKRSDPALLLPGCRSVVVAIMNYWPGEQAAPVPVDRARVSLYAQGRDYHKILGRRLGRVAAWLAERTGEPTRAFVDTAPVLERGWAERAGLGWIGKNANLLTRDLGSWVLIGEILTVADLEPDAGPHADFCGTCRACIDGCPTGAIVADGVVDSNRCISYWTIEHRGDVPEERRNGMADWIFGCDDCQTVCPWNQTFARPRDDDLFDRRDDLRGLDPEAVLAMNENEFRSRYSGTSLMRAKWEGMRRNACIVLGNRPTRGATAALGEALEDPDPVVRSHAAWALARIAGRRPAQDRPPKLSDSEKH
jgi:epoxyqueuosine reductase